MRGLATDGQLATYRHEGFWLGMDTLRDRNHMQELWELGRAPWRTWR
jgi:glucose-1-phosphate cytidylyltransferase